MNRHSYINMCHHLRALYVSFRCSCIGHFSYLTYPGSFSVADVQYFEVPGSNHFPAFFPSQVPAINAVPSLGSFTQVRHGVFSTLIAIIDNIGRNSLPANLGLYAVFTLPVVLAFVVVQSIEHAMLSLKLPKWNGEPIFSVADCERVIVWESTSKSALLASSLSYFLPHCCLSCVSPFPLFSPFEFMCWLISSCFSPRIPVVPVVY